MGLVRLEKASNVARDRSSYYDSSQNIGENCRLDLCTTIFKMATISSMKIICLDSFLQTCAISMILVSNHTFLTMQNLNVGIQ